MNRLRLALRFARRELRGGFAGFRIFFLCLALGSAAIAGVESLSDAFLTGLQDQGQVLLGGDVSVRLVHRPASPEERRFLDSQGRVSRTITMRAMVYARGGTGRQLVELKAVDDRWPLFGSPRFAPPQKLSDVIACEDDGVCGVAAEQALFDRMGVARGDLVRLGNATFRLMGVLEKEPDRVSTGFSLGPRLLLSARGLPATGLVTPESLVDYTYRVALRPGISIAGFRAAADRAFPDAGWQIRDRHDAAPGIRRFVEQLTMFLTLVGLVALGVAGVGANLAVDANGRFDFDTALAYARALEPYGLRWYEEIGDPLDYQLNSRIAQAYAGPIATGENLFSLPDVNNLLRFGGLRPASDILHNLAAMKQFDVRTFQAEDEIAAMGSIIGAAFGGAFAVTASAGPGIALKSEAINLAVDLIYALVDPRVRAG